MGKRKSCHKRNFEVKNYNHNRRQSNVAFKHKDTVFCLLYQDKKNLLELYNALNGSNHTNIDDLTVTTLSGSIYIKYKNDASFVFEQNLYMFEQQASKNPNMPLRFLHYVSDVLRELFPNKLLHQRTMLKIPVPHFITFYNGQETMSESEKVLKLSDMFEYATDTPELELSVKVININPDSDTDILNKCSSLRDYMLFVNKVRFKKNKQQKSIETAVVEAVDECINEGILADFFESNRSEVIRMSIYEYDEEGTIQVLKEEEYRFGHEAGLAEGLTKGISEGRNSALISMIVKKVKKNKSLAVIADELEEDIACIEPIYNAVISCAPDYDEVKILNTVLANKSN